jgi:hypothetical protein
MQTFALRPTATGPGRSRAAYDAWQATARYAALAAHAESPPHRSRDPQVRSPVAAAVGRVRRAAGESHPPTPGLPALGPIGRIRTGLVTAVHSADRTTVHDCLGPVNTAGSREPIECREVDEIPHTRQLPVAQATPARHPRPAPEFLREHLPGNAAAKDEDNAGEARAIGDPRPSAT